MIDCDNDQDDDKIVFHSRKRGHNNDGARFNKSVHLKSIIHDEPDDPVIDLPKMKGSKLVMPEYVIGQKKEKKKSTTKSGSVEGAEKKPSQVLKLNHLFEEEEEENEE